jgi:hypothetical protein
MSLTAAGLVVVAGCYFAARGEQGAIGSWGLVQALPMGYFACLGLLCVLFLKELLGRRVRGRVSVLATQLVGLVVLLHGAPGFLEEHPRCPTAWLHVGFVGQILEHHVSPGTVDARFNWPGFFGAGAAVTGAGGLDSALPLLRWAPVVMVLLYLIPVYLIGRQLTGSFTVTWLGMWLFVSVNWVGQDYFAPQTMAFLLYLTAVAILVSFFRQTRPRRVGRRKPWVGRLPYDGRPDIPTTPRIRVLLIGALLVILLALSMSHQLTPIMLTVSAGALVLVGRSRLIVFPLVAGVVTLAWISVGTTPYWVGHLDKIFGDVGNVHSVVSNSVGERVEGSAGHLMVVKLRLAFTAGVWLLMGAAALRLTLLRRPPLTLFTLAITPFLMLMQNYGSEGVLRIFLFSSPFSALLIAQLVYTHLPVRWMPGTTVAALLLVLPLFVVTRYGNETFEQVRGTEVSAMRSLYATAPEGSVFFSPTSQVPWRFQDATEYRYQRPDNVDPFVDADPQVVRDPISATPRGDGKTYLVITRSQIIYGHEALGFPEDWFERLHRLLTPENGYHLQVHNSDSWIYRFERQS